ncbi:MAG: DUF2764 family protein [Planctomycetota bacterium]
MARHAYYTLIASLPRLPARFEVGRDPITPQRLDERLKMLEPDDAEVLDQLVDFLAWERQPLDRTDDEVIARYHALIPTIRNPLVGDLIEDRMGLRTIISGLRRRRAGLPPPRGVGRLTGHVQRNWSHPTFNLEGRRPWIEPFARLLDDGDAAEAERLLFSVTWKHWSRLAERYYFSFEAVLLYVARWWIIDRWTSRDAAAGRKRFEELITETLGEYANLSP